MGYEILELKIIEKEIKWQTYGEGLFSKFGWQKSCCRYEIFQYQGKAVLDNVVYCRMYHCRTGYVLTLGFSRCLQDIIDLFPSSKNLKFDNLFAIRNWAGPGSEEVARKSHLPFLQDYGNGDEGVDYYEYRSINDDLYNNIIELAKMGKI